MKVVNMVAVVDGDKCTGCTICDRVCPTLAIKTTDHLAVVEAALCSGCIACEQRCPEYAIRMELLAVTHTLAVDVSRSDRAQVAALCRRAHFNPEQLICYCTATRAEEVAAAILQGAASPEELSRLTGIRTGCKVECIQPILRLLDAAGVHPTPPKGGWQWYGKTVTAWDIPEETRKKYSRRGFYFDADLEVLNRVVDAPAQTNET